MRVLALMLFAVVLAGCGAGQDQDPDPESLRGYAERYVSLLNAKDEPALRGHLANDNQPQDAAERIAAHGDGGWALTGVSWAVSESPRAFALTMQVTGRPGTAVWTHNVEWHDGSWTMGPLNGRPGGSSTVRPS